MIVGVLTTCHTQYTWVRSIRQGSGLCSSSSRNIPELKVQIRTTTVTITADMLQTVWNDLDYRVYVCRITKGAHIEHLKGI